MLVGGQKESFHEGELCVKRSKCTIKSKCTVNLTYFNLLRSLTNPVAFESKNGYWERNSPKTMHIYTKAQDHDAKCDFRSKNALKKDVNRGAAQSDEATVLGGKRVLSDRAGEGKINIQY
jgi:hypothetical protein